jgi:hypothetical protein
MVGALSGIKPAWHLPALALTIASPNTCTISDLPAADLPAADLPAADLPAADLPAADLPAADLPAADGIDQLIPTCTSLGPALERAPAPRATATAAASRPMWVLDAPPKHGRSDPKPRCSHPG